MKILIVKTSSLGDIVHSFPVIEYLHKRDQNNIIDWVVESPYASLVHAHPHVNQVIEIHTKHWKKHFFQLQTFSEIISSIKNIRRIQYDLVIDLQGNVKSAIPTFLSKAHIKIGFDRHSISEWPNLLVTNQKQRIPQNRNIREDYLNLVKNYFNDAEPFNFINTTLKINEDEKIQLDNFFENKKIKNQNCIMVCPGSRWKNKQLSDNQLSNLLHKIFIEENEPTFIFVWGSSIEKKICENLHKIFGNSIILEKVSLPLLQNFMFKVKKVIAMDSFPLHLAGTTETPTFGIFGPSSPLKYAPLNHSNYFGKCPYNHVFEKRCEFLRSCKTGACLKEKAPEEIFKSYYSLCAKVKNK